MEGSIVQKRKESMLQGPLLPSIISFTIPVILTSVLQLLFNAADLVVVGAFRGSASVGAVGATNSVTHLLVNLFVGLSVGAGVAVVHGLGSHHDEEVHHTVHTALPLALVGGVLLTVVGVFISKPLLKLMDTPAELLDLSALYMKIYFGGITFTVVYNFCAAILRAAGDTKSPLVYLVIAGCVNVALNVVFVKFFHMNVEGVALATIASQALSAALVMLALVRRDDSCHLDLRKLHFHGPQLAKILCIGLPAGIQGSLFSVSNVIIQKSVNSFGEVFVAGNSAAVSIEGFMYVTLNSFHQTVVNFVGQNVGARQYRRANQVVMICFACVAVAGVVLSGLVYFFGEALLSIYIRDSAQAIADGMIRLSFVSIPYFVLGMMDVSTGALRGYGSSVAPMIISVLGVCGIRIGWIYTIFEIPAYHTPQWLYISYPVSWLVTFLAQLTVFLFLVRKYRNQENRL